MNSKIRKPLAGLVALCSVSIVSVAFAQQREVRELGEFTGISVGGGVDLYLRQTDAFSVEVVAEDGDTDNIVTDVRNGTLEIRRRESITQLFDWRNDYSVHVAMPQLQSLTASGGSDVRTEGRFSGDSLTIHVSGGSDTTIEFDVDTLEIRASGGSDLSLTGNARSADIATSGGSDVAGRRLEIGEANVRSSGGSDISVTVRDRLVAAASGGSDITYEGNPDYVDVDKSGSGDVRHR